MPLIQRVFSFSLLLSALLLNGCSQPTPAPIKTQMIVFGTQVNISLYPNNATEVAQSKIALQAIETEFYQFHQDWHAWDKGGILSKINQAIRDEKTIEVADSVKAFIVKSQVLAKDSGYLFDPGIGSLIQLWGFHSETWQGPPPSQTGLTTWLKQHPSIADITFEGPRLSSKNPFVSLDFGGNAKGLALDIAMDTLKQNSIPNAIVDIGGDMRIRGDKQGQPFHIGIQDPKNPQQAIASLDLQGDESVVTSGTYQRFFEWQGQRFSHILDPRTAYPANAFASVTVIHSDATTADAAATALMIAGKDWQKVAQAMGVEQVFIIDGNGNFFFTPQMRNRIKLL